MATASSPTRPSAHPSGTKAIFLRTDTGSCPKFNPYTVVERGREMHKKSEYWCKSFEWFWLQERECSVVRILEEGFIFSHKVKFWPQVTCWWWFSGSTMSGLQISFPAIFQTFHLQLQDGPDSSEHDVLHPVVSKAKASGTAHFFSSASPCQAWSLTSPQARRGFLLLAQGPHLGHVTTAS